MSRNMPYDVRDDEDLSAVLYDLRRRDAVVEVKASWCPHCRNAVGPFQRLATRNPDILFVTADVEKVPSVKTVFRSNGLPTFHLVRNGRVAGSVEGADMDALQRMIDSAYSSTG